jgi:hypothetical protein
MNQKFIQLKIYNIFAKDYFLSEEEEEDQVLLSTFEKKQKSLLYPDARITVKDFSALFMGIISRLGNLPATQCEDLLEFIRVLIPSENNLPESYYRINNSFHKSEVTEFRLCSICQEQLNSKKKCPSVTCISNMSLHSLKPIKVFILDINKQITFILENNYQSILNNLGKYFILVKRLF